MNKLIKSIICGLGNIGLKYDIYNNKIHTHSKSIFFHKKFILLNVIDKKIANRKLFFKKYGIQTSSFLNEKIKKINPDLVIISLPTKIHLLFLKKLVKIFKPKYLMIEKPLGSNLSEAKKIISICKKNSIKLFSNYIRNYDKLTQQIKKEIDKKFLKNFKINVYYNHDLRNNCCHIISLMLFWFGKNKTVKLTKKIDKNNYNFFIKFDNCDVYFYCKEQPNSKTDLKIFDNNYEIDYKNDGEIIKYTDKKNGKIKVFHNKNYKNMYQYYVYDELYKNLKNNFFFTKSAQNALDTQIIIDKIIKKNEKKI